MAVAFAVSWGMGVAFPPGDALVHRLIWAVLTIILAVLTAMVVARVLRRLAPLAWLLKLDVAFPGEAPSRLSVAMRSARTADLAADLEAQRLGEDDAHAARLILQMSAAMRAHDRHSRYHSERVRGYTRMIGEAMGVTREDLDKLAWAGLLHDVGKLVIDPAILNKPRALDEEEMAVIRRHPIEGARMARPLMPWLGSWGLAIAHHHERWDGGGYPAGLSGRVISLGGRIVAVADAFEAMTTKRAYNTPRTLDNARRELVDCAGTQFDPDVVRALLSVPLSRLSRVALPSAALGVIPSLHDVLGGWGEAVQITPIAVRQAAVAAAGTAVVAATVLGPGAVSGGDTAAAPSDGGTGNALTNIEEVASSIVGDQWTVRSVVLTPDAPTPILPPVPAPLPDRPRAEEAGGPPAAEADRAAGPTAAEDDRPSARPPGPALPRPAAGAGPEGPPPPQVQPRPDPDPVIDVAAPAPVPAVPDPPVLPDIPGGLHEPGESAIPASPVNDGSGGITDTAPPPPAEPAPPGPPAGPPNSPSLPDAASVPDFVEDLLEDLPANPPPFAK